MGRARYTRIDFFLFNRRRRETRMWRTLFLRFQKRWGFSLLEVGLAIAVISGVLVTSLSSVVGALNLQFEADRLALAMSLAQSKIAEMRSSDDLAATESEGEFTSTDDLYYGYRWKTAVKEENLSIEEILKNSFSDLPLGDQLPSGAQNNSGTEKDSLFSEFSKGFASLGDVPILRITIVIEYPKGRGAYGEYKVETLQRLERSRPSPKLSQ